MHRMPSNRFDFVAKDFDHWMPCGSENGWSRDAPRMTSAVVDLNFVHSFHSWTFQKRLLWDFVGNQSMFLSCKTQICMTNKPWFEPWGQDICQLHPQKWKNGPDHKKRNTLTMFPKTVLLTKSNHWKCKEIQNTWRWNENVFHDLLHCDIVGQLMRNQHFESTFAILIDFLWVTSLSNKIDLCCHLFFVQIDFWIHSQHCCSWSLRWCATDRTDDAPTWPWNVNHLCETCSWLTIWSNCTDGIIQLSSKTDKIFLAKTSFSQISNSLLDLESKTVNFLHHVSWKPQFCLSLVIAWTNLQHVFFVTIIKCQSQQCDHCISFHKGTCAPFCHMLCMCVDEPPNRTKDEKHVFLLQMNSKCASNLFNRKLKLTLNFQFETVWMTEWTFCWTCSWNLISIVSFQHTVINCIEGPHNSLMPCSATQTSKLQHQHFCWELANWCSTTSSQVCCGTGTVVRVGLAIGGMKQCLVFTCCWHGTFYIRQLKIYVQIKNLAKIAHYK